MTERMLLDEMAKMGAIITGSYIVYTSGKHGPGYVNKNEIYTNPALLFGACAEIASKIFRFCCEERVSEIAIVAPAVAGVAISQYTTLHLNGLGMHAIALFADKEEIPCELYENTLVRVGDQYEKLPDDAKLFFTTGGFTIGRGYIKKILAVQNSAVVVVEDVLTTGGSVKRVVEDVRKVGGNVIMAAALCNRGKVTAEDVGVPCLESVINVSFDAYDENVCPLCASGVPINAMVGHGREFLARKFAGK